MRSYDLPPDPRQVRRPQRSAHPSPRVLPGVAASDISNIGRCRRPSSCSPGASCVSTRSGGTPVTQQLALCGSTRDGKRRTSSHRSPSRRSRSPDRKEDDAPRRLRPLPADLRPEPRAPAGAAHPPPVQPHPAGRGRRRPARPEGAARAGTVGRLARRCERRGRQHPAVADQAERASATAFPSSRRSPRSGCRRSSKG
jgi:hypothetical protein